MDQQNPQELTPDEAAASLAFITKLSENMMPKAEETEPETAPQGQESAPQQEEAPEVEEQPTKPNQELETLRTEMDAKMEMLNKTIQETIKQEIGGIKESIQDVLTEDDGEQV